jgi:hypothetical protein
MAMICPDCLRRSLRVTQSIELPYDTRSDEITLQVIACAWCDFEGIAVYEESRRGGFDSESVDHRGYYVSADALTVIKRQIEHCPDPRNQRCRCASHRVLGRKDELGRWEGLREIEVGRRFSMML